MPELSPEPYLQSVEAVRDRMIRTFRERHADMGPAMDYLIKALNHARTGGKLMRPRLLWSSYQAHGGSSNPNALPDYRLAIMGAALEMFQDAALIHDDIIDRSASRRGQLSLFRELEQAHKEANWSGNGEHFGTSVALIIGDITLIAAERAFRQAVTTVTNPEQREFMVALHEETKSDVMFGQFLDVLTPRLPDIPPPDELIHQAMEIIKLKTARYSVATPLALGASAAGAPRREAVAMATCGLPIGVAFQLRDDQLGATGDPAETGKPAGGDLLEGKRTVLVGMTLRRLSPHDRRNFIRALQRGEAPLAEERVSHLQHMIVQSGALDELEELIQKHVAEASEALERSELDQAGRDLLVAMGNMVANRRS